jgi:hypothetical protein
MAGDAVFRGCRVRAARNRITHRGQPDAVLDIGLAEVHQRAADADGARADHAHAERM